LTLYKNNKDLSVMIYLSDCHYRLGNDIQDRQRVAIADEWLSERACSRSGRLEREIVFSGKVRTIDIARWSFYKKSFLAA